MTAVLKTTFMISEIAQVSSKFSDNYASVQTIGRIIDETAPVAQK